jgi:gentisate 1,2-dioxygenase
MQRSQRAVRSKSTDNNVYVVLRGSVRFAVGDVVDDVLTFGDLLTVPCWHEHSWEALEDALVLRVSDEPVMRALGFLRGREWEVPAGEAAPRAGG